MAQSYVSPFTADVIVPGVTTYNQITLISNSVLAWPDSQAVSSTIGSNVFYAARIIDIQSQSANLVLALPPGSQAATGTDILIRNKGANSIFITDSGGNQQTIIQAGVSIWFYLTTNDTATGSWSNVTFGTGTSQADAVSLAGGGVAVDSSSKLSINFPVTTVTASSFSLDYTSNGKTYNWSTTSGTGACTLPNNVQEGWTVLVKNNGTGALSLSPPSGWTVDSVTGSGAIQLLPGESTFIIAQPSVLNFVTIGRNRLSNFYFSASIQDINSTGSIIDLRQYATIIQRYRNSGTGQASTVYLPASTNTYYIVNTTGFDLTFQVGSTVIGNVARIQAGTAATAVCDGTNVYATNSIPVGSLTIDSSSSSAPSIKASGQTNTGLFASTGTVGLTILGGGTGNSTLTLTQKSIILSPGTTGYITAILDGGIV